VKCSNVGLPEELQKGSTLNSRITLWFFAESAEGGMYRSCASAEDRRQNSTCWELGVTFAGG